MRTTDPEITKMADEPLPAPEVVAAANAALTPDERIRASHLHLRKICSDRCAGCVHMESGGALGCARLIRETEIADANSRKDAEEAKKVRTALLLPDRPSQADAYKNRACPVLIAWDALEDGAEPDIAAVLDSTSKFLQKGGLPPLSPA